MPAATWIEARVDVARAAVERRSARRSVEQWIFTSWDSSDVLERTVYVPLSS
jgi:hypothetical protein